jgi:Tfp pilus assembly PilM family ATPase
MLDYLFHSKSTGLDLDADSIKLVQLGKTFNRIRLLKYGEEKIDNSKPGPDAVIAALQKLLAQLKISQKEVTLHLGGKGVRHLVLEAPLLPLAELPDWVQHHLHERFGHAFSAAQIAFSFHVLEQTEEKLRIMAAYCQRQALSEKLAVIERAGLVPIPILLRHEK